MKLYYILCLVASFVGGQYVANVESADGAPADSVLNGPFTEESMLLDADNTPLQEIETCLQRAEDSPAERQVYLFKARYLIENRMEYIRIMKRALANSQAACDEGIQLSSLAEAERKLLVMSVCSSHMEDVEEQLSALKHESERYAEWLSHIRQYGVVRKSRAETSQLVQDLKYTDLAQQLLKGGFDELRHIVGEIKDTEKLLVHKSPQVQQVAKAKILELQESFTANCIFLRGLELDLQQVDEHLFKTFIPAA